MRLATVTTPGGTTAALLGEHGWRALPAPDLSALLAAAEADGGWDPARVVAQADELDRDLPGAVPCWRCRAPGR